MILDVSYTSSNKNQQVVIRGANEESCCDYNIYLLYMYNYIYIITKFLYILPLLSVFVLYIYAYHEPR